MRKIARRAPSEAEGSAPPGSFARLTRGLAHYELSGPEGGPLVVLVPGLSVPYATWDRNAPALAAAGCRVLRYDHYGRGYSDRPRVRYRLELFVEQLTELLSALDLDEPAVLVGLSMGGPVAAAAAARPGFARAVVLVDPLHEQPRLGPAARLLLAPLIGDAMIALAGGRILAESQRADFSDPASYEEFIPSYRRQLSHGGIGRAVLGTMRGLRGWPLAETFEALGRSGLPLFVIWGSEDAVLPFEGSSRLLRALPGAELKRVDGAGHVPQWERADEVNGALLEFLGRVSRLSNHPAPK